LKRAALQPVPLLHARAPVNYDAARHSDLGVLLLLLLLKHEGHFESVSAQVDD